MEISNKKLIFACLIMTFFCLNPFVFADNWWNSSWHFRMPVNVSYSYNFENASVNVEDINFTDIINNDFDGAGTFDKNSIRLIEGNFSLPYDFDNISWDTGNITFIANGTTQANNNRTFYIYFDVEENDLKSIGKIMSDKPYWRSGYENNMDIYSNIWNRSWAKSVEVFWSWSVEEGWEDYAYIYVDGIEVGNHQGKSSEIKLYNGNSIYARFKSDDGGIDPTTDEYGTYGTAINITKFYPTANYTTPDLNIFQSNAEAQPLFVSVNLEENSYSFGEKIKFSGLLKDDFDKGINSTIHAIIYYPDKSIAWQNIVQSNESGNYNDSLLAEWTIDGNYSINITAQKHGYANATNSSIFSYLSNKYPDVKNRSVNPINGAWGQNYEYIIDIFDQENDTVNVSLWINTSNGWIKNETKSIIPPGNLTWNLAPFWQSDVKQTKAFKFEYRDNFHSLKNTTVYFGPTLGKNNISIEYLTGNNIQINRSGIYEIMLGVKLKDIIRNLYVNLENISFWGYYSSQWNLVGSNLTNIEGNATFNFNPSCSVEVGLHNWKANHSGQYYKNNESDLFSFRAIGQLKNNLENLNNTYKQGSIIPIKANIVDECGANITEANVSFIINNSYECIADEVGNGMYKCDWDSQQKPIGNYSIRINSSKIINYLSNSTIFEDVFCLESGAPIININLSNDFIKQNSFVNINATIIDQSGKGIEWVKINITRPNGIIDQEDMINITDNIWTINYTNDWGNTTQRGIYNITIWAMDNNSATGATSKNLGIWAKLNASLGTIENSYYQGDSGSVYYRIKDFQNNYLDNVSVNLKINGPDDFKVYFLSGTNYTTDNEGLIATPVYYVISSDAPVGNYNLTGTSYYFDNLVNYTCNITSVYSFTVKSNIDLKAKLEIPAIMYVDHKLTIAASTFESGQWTDVDNITIKVYDLKHGTPIEWFCLTKENLSKTDTGIYTYSQEIKNDDAGNYLAILNITKQQKSTGDIKTFDIQTGGPFDVLISTIQNEVEAGGYLDFVINVSNKGDTDQFDVELKYKIDDGSVYWTSEFVQVDAHSTNAFKRSFSIYSDEIFGMHNLSIAVYYGNDKIANSSTTFRVIAPSSKPSGKTTTGGSSIEINTSDTSLISKIQIIKYPKEILIEKGNISYITLTVNNNGQSILHNISIEVEGLPIEWVKWQAKKIDFLKPSELKNFILKFDIPFDIETKNYLVKIKIKSNEAEDEKILRLKIFASREELLLYQIQNLKDVLDNFKKRALDIQSKGQNISSLKDDLQRTEEMILIAEKYINQKKYDEAILSIKKIETAIDEIKYKLKQLEILPITIIQEVKVPRVLDNYILLILIILSLMVVLSKLVPLIGQRKIKNEIQKIQLYTDIKKAVLRKPANRRIIKLLNLLNLEHKQGLISDDVYSKLKQINEDKLREEQIIKDSMQIFKRPAFKSRIANMENALRNTEEDKTKDIKIEYKFKKREIKRNLEWLKQYIKELFQR